MKKMTNYDLSFLDRESVVVCKGIDPRDGFPYYLESRLHSDRNTSTMRCTCFDHDIPILKELGYRISKHWKYDDMSAVYGLTYCRPHRNEKIEVDKRIVQFLNRERKNKMFVHLLSQKT